MIIDGWLDEVVMHEMTTIIPVYSHEEKSRVFCINLRRGIYCVEPKVQWPTAVVSDHFVDAVARLSHVTVHSRQIIVHQSVCHGKPRPTVSNCEHKWFHSFSRPPDNGTDLMALRIRTLTTTICRGCTLLNHTSSCKKSPVHCPSNRLFTCMGVVPIIFIRAFDHHTHLCNTNTEYRAVSHHAIFPAKLCY